MGIFPGAVTTALYNVLSPPNAIGTPHRQLDHHLPSEDCRRHFEEQHAAGRSPRVQLRSTREFHYGSHYGAGLPCSLTTSPSCLLPRDFLPVPLSFIFSCFSVLLPPLILLLSLHILLWLFLSSSSSHVFLVRSPSSSSAGRYRMPGARATQRELISLVRRGGGWGEAGGGSVEVMVEGAFRC